jgi:hypothetical protein
MRWDAFMINRSSVVIRGYFAGTHSKLPASSVLPRPLVASSNLQFGTKCLEHHELAPELRDMELRPVDCRRAGENAVVVIGIPLGFGKSRPPAAVADPALQAPQRPGESHERESGKPGHGLLQPNQIRMRGRICYARYAITPRARHWPARAPDARIALL